MNNRTLGQRPDSIERFPDGKFLVALCKSKSGPALTSARLRALAWWWCAQNFSADWLMNLAQLFGIPFRWATYSQNANDATVTAIGTMLSDMGSNGYGAFPEGTNLNFLEGGKNAGQSPQADLMERADKNCDLLILGQTLTSDVGAGGGGSLALGQVHAGVRGQIFQSAADFVARVLNQQLIPAILTENYGDAKDAPYFTPKPESQKDLQATSLMIQTAVATGFKVPAKWAHAELNIPLPQPGEETINAPAPASPFGSRFGVPPSGGPQPETRNPEPETQTEEDPAALEARRAAPPAPTPEQEFAASIAAKTDPVLALLNRISDIKDDAVMLRAFERFLAEADTIKQVVAADVRRSQLALEKITAPAFARGLEGKTP